MTSINLLAASFARQQRAEGKRPATIRTYGDAIRHLASAASDDINTLDRRFLSDYFGSLLERYAASSVSIRFRGIRVFVRWAVEEGELAADPLAKLRQPKVRVTPPPIYSDVDVKRLLNACEGTTLADRRDAAIVALLTGTGMRRGELAGLKVSDVDLDASVCVVDGKTGQRLVPFGKQATQALDRYMRLRARTRSHSERSELWVGPKGPMTGNGIYQAIRGRARMAGVSGAYVHRFRHSFAHKALSLGMNEGEVMSICGWVSRSMLDRYGASAASARAIEAYRRLVA